MDELEFYQGQHTGLEVDTAINAALNPDAAPDPDSTGLISSAAVAATATALAGAIAIVVDGDKSAVAATIGQYVVLQNSTIEGCSDGLYTAAQAIPAATTIDSTYLTAVTGGGLNAVNEGFTDLKKFKKVAVGPNATVNVTVSNTFRSLVISTGIDTNTHGLWIFCTRSTGGTAYLTQIFAASYLTVTASANTLTLKSNTGGSQIDVFIVQLGGSVTS